MNNTLITVFAALLLGMAACSPSHPQESEVREKVVGNYCAEGYRLELRQDSSFFNMRVQAGVLGNKPLVEKCVGKYRLVFDESASEWQIEFIQEDKGFTVASCTGKIPVWNKKDGWMKGDSILTLPEWFDKKPVKKGACEI